MKSLTTDRLPPAIRKRNIWKTTILKRRTLNKGSSEQERNKKGAILKRKKLSNGNYEKDHSEKGQI